MKVFIPRNKLVITLGVFLLWSCSKPDHAELYQEIKSADKMVFASMAITKTAKLESKRWYTVGKRIAVYSYDSYMRAYVDLSELQEEDIVFDEKNKKVKVTLPPVKIEVSGRDMDMRKEYDNIGLFRDSLDAKERAAIKEIANKSFNKEIVKNAVFREQLTESAKRKARTYFETIFKGNGYEPIIDFKLQ